MFWIKKFKVKNKNFKNILLTLIIILGLIYIVIYVFVAVNAEKDNSIKSDSIIVLGAKSIKDGRSNPCLIARVEHAVDLYKNGMAKKIILSGGTDKEDGVNEAETMQKIALDLGVKQEDIILEKNSTSTYENILFSKKIMSENGLKTSIIVTEPFHSPRAGLIAQKLNVNHSISPAKKSACWKPFNYISFNILREPFAILEYLIKGEI